jgi:hypothetical protein
MQRARPQDRRCSGAPAPQDLALAGRLQPRQHGQQRRFAGPVGADQRNGAARGQRQRDLVHHPAAPVLQHQALGGEYGCTRCIRRGSCIRCVLWVVHGNLGGHDARRRRASRMMKNGPPAMAVISPSGTSAGAARCAPGRRPR